MAPPSVVLEKLLLEKQDGQESFSPPGCDDDVVVLPQVASITSSSYWRLRL